MNGIRQEGMVFFTEIDGVAIDRLLGDWRATYPQVGLLALVAEKDRDRAPALLQELCNRRGIPLCGAVFPALLADHRFCDRGCILLRFDVMPFACIYPGIDPDGSVAEALARDVIAHAPPSGESTLFLIFDAMVATIASFLDGLYLSLANRVRYMGANAGSETFRPIPCLFDNRRITGDGVLAILLPDHPGAVVEHCYRAPKRLISATATIGNRIVDIDWRPAFDAYREAASEEYGVVIDRENFYRIAVHFPFGIMRASGNIVVRMPVALEEDGSIFCVGEVPPNALLTLLRAPEIDSRQTVDTLVAGLHLLHGPCAGMDLLTFYCAGRRIHLGAGAESELEELHASIAPRFQAGALSLGEIGDSMGSGYPLFHNGALVCSRWGGA